MKKNFHDYIPFILLILTISIMFSYNNSYASNLKVVGDTEGLAIIPKDTKMFDLNNLNPGDKEEIEITLENKYIDCYIDIFVRTERASKAPEEGEAELLEQLKVKVYLEEALIYDGEMKGFATTNTSLGTLELNEDKKIRVVARLPGYETGNEFQGKELKVNWIFTAQSNCSTSDTPIEVSNPEIPIEGTIGRLVQTGATPDIFYYSIGALIFSFGYFIYKKK